MAIVGPLKLNVQIMGSRGPAIGPGKAMVLEAIERTGSISAAGRDLGMSYRRIWLLVSSLNGDWAQAVVETRPGSRAGSGACLTAFGREMLERYRTVEATMLAAAAGDELSWLLASLPAPEQGSPAQS